MGFNPFKTLRDAAELRDRIVREEIDDPRQWETELADLPEQEPQR